MRRQARVQALVKFQETVSVPAVFGGVIGENGELELDVVGVRRRGYPEAAALGDRVHIGSCLKMITASLFGTFVNEHQADWDMPVTDLFPDLANSIATGWQQQTVAEFFYCTAGMVANPPRRIFKSAYTDTRLLPLQRTQLSEHAFSQPPHKPGHFVYSNMSYIVMGAAIDRLSGSSFEHALNARLLGPLGITTAGYGPPPVVWGHAPRITLGGQALLKGKSADPLDKKSDNPPVMSSAGTLHLNCEDWAKLLCLFQVKNNPGIIEDKIIERILQLPANKTAPMSMGWAPVKLDGLSYGAQGSNLRWSATALMDDARRRIAFVVCNDGRSSVLSKSVPLARGLLEL